MQEWRKMALLMEIRLQKNKKMLVLAYHVQYDRKSFGEGKDVFMKSDEYPLDLYSPVEGKIEIKIR